MQLSPESIEALNSYSLDEWVTAFDQVYSQIDSRRTAEGILLHIVEHAGEVHEDIRIGRYHRAITHIADVVCWTCGLVSKCVRDPHYEIERSYHEQVISKFPRRCYHCLSEHCVCSSTIGAAIEDKAAKELRRRANDELRRHYRDLLKVSDQEPRSLLALQRMFEAIYSHMHRMTPLEYLVAHFQEEVGEIAECINNLEDIRGNHMPRGHVVPDSINTWTHELELELPDVLSWLIALLFKLDHMLGSALLYYTSVSPISGQWNIGDRGLLEGSDVQTLGLTLPIILWNRYGTPGIDPRESLLLRCPRCQQTPCIG